MNFKKIITLLLAFTLTLSLAACGSKGDGKGDGDAQGATAEDIYAQIQELADKENAIMEENLELWQKLFAAMNEKRDEIPDESNYGAYLLAALDLVKDQFTEDELKTLTEGSEKIRDLEDQIQPLQEQYAALQPAGDSEDGGMNDSVPAFPAFTGKDLDGNDVDNSIFSQNAVTVVNFWFSGCKPCVAELGELNALNERAARSSASTSIRSTATPMRSARPRTCLSPRVQATRTSTSPPTAQPATLRATSWPSRPPMSSTAAAPSSVRRCSAASTMRTTWQRSRS